MAEVSAGVVLREWGRIGCIGFGGPPAHIRLLRELCVSEHDWLSPVEFEDAVAVCNLLPGPASTQLAIFCAWRVAGVVGAIVGALAFIVPGLIAILALAALLLSRSAPTWVLAAGAGAAAAVPVVALRAGADLLPPSWRRAAEQGFRGRWIAYVIAGALAAWLVGPWLVLVLLGCGVAEVSARSWSSHTRGLAPWLVGLPSLAVASPLAWVAFKVGALSYGGGFVIIPLMRADAVDRYHWMSNAQFLNAVALGQITPGPVVQTVAVVGYAAAGLVGGILAAVVAFTPSILGVSIGAPFFGRMRTALRPRQFLDGAGPAAAGAILGSCVALAGSLSHGWQFALMAAALLLVFAGRRGIVLTLLLSGLVGVVVVALGGGV